MVTSDEGWLNALPQMANLLRDWDIVMLPTLPDWGLHPDGQPMAMLRTGCFNYIILKVWRIDDHECRIWDVSFRRVHIDAISIYQACADEPENAIRIAEWIYHRLFQIRYPSKTAELNAVSWMRKDYKSELKLRAG